MDLSLTTLRSALQQERLQSPDLIFWFEHTAFPLLVTCRHPNEYLQRKWDKLKERRLMSITTGFSAKGESLQSGFAPVNLMPPLVNDLREIRIVRFIPDSGDISFESTSEPDSGLDITTLGCKMKSAAVVAKIGDINANEREVYIDDLFDLQVTLHSRKIEF